MLMKLTLIYNQRKKKQIISMYIAFFILTAFNKFKKEDPINKAKIH